MNNLIGAVVVIFIFLQPFSQANAESEFKDQLDDRLSGNWYVSPTGSYLNATELKVAKDMCNQPGEYYENIIQGYPGSFQYYYEGACEYSNVLRGREAGVNHYFVELACQAEGMDDPVDNGSFLFLDSVGDSRETYLLFLRSYGLTTYLKCPK